MDKRSGQIARLTVVARRNHANLIDLRAVTVARMGIGSYLVGASIVVDKCHLCSQDDRDVSPIRRKLVSAYAATAPEEGTALCRPVVAQTMN